MPLRPWRTGSAEPRPDVPLPPHRMPMLRGRRPLKRWHYIGCFTEDVLLCAAVARIGPLPVSWWAAWDREQRTLAEETLRGRPAVRFDGGRVVVDSGPVRIDLLVGSAAAVETISPHGREYAWTRKQGGVPVAGTVRIGDRRHRIDGFGVVDESAGYHARHTAWKWSAGVGTAADGRPVAWNLVTGIHDAPTASERSVWIGGRPEEVGPVRFDGLDGIAFAEGGTLRFAAESTRAQDENLLLFASSYEQPFGTFTGSLPGAGELREGFGVMERHDVRW
jgi:hypothetical protein